MPTPDPGRDINDVAALVQRGLLLQALVRAVAVVVPCVLGQDLAEMPLAEDQRTRGEAYPRTVPRMRSPVVTGPAS
jgi:hypothetical protein